MDSPKVICIGGPTGVGKDTIVSLFIKEEPEFIRIPRVTTRYPRANEVRGLHYYFLSYDEFRRKESCGHICAVDDFLGHLYGVNIGKIFHMLQVGKNVIGVFGVCSFALRPIFGQQSVLIYLSAPLPILESRLIERGDSPDQITLRMTAAKKQMEEEPRHFDHVIENTGTINGAVLKLRHLVHNV